MTSGEELLTMDSDDAIQARLNAVADMGPGISPKLHGLALSSELLSLALHVKPRPARSLAPCVG